MKKLITGVVILMVLGILSCSKKDNSTSINKTVVNSVSTGNWKITYFLNTGTDNTSDFSGYSFTFGSNNVLLTFNVTNTYTGSWSVVNKNSSDDSLDDLDFIISFSSPVPFGNLSEDWDILSRTDSKIELKHVSGGNGGTGLLTFEKN